jgi:hypothetical protein
MRNGILSFVAVGLICTLGCGGGGDDKDSSSSSGGTTVQSSVSKDKLLSSVNQDDLNAIGESYKAALSSDKVMNAVCNMSGLFATAFAGLGGAGAMNAPSCEDMVSQCKAAYKDAPLDAAGSSVTQLPTTTSLAGCSVTVGQLEACLTASLDAIANTLGNVTCDSDLTKINADAASVGNLDACKELTTKCPNALPSASADTQL